MERNVCAFCGLEVLTRGHHVVPKCKGGETIVPTCETCESFIHKTWSHNELRDTFNSVATIKGDERFRKFLSWRLRQPVATVFKSTAGRQRDKRKYH